MFVVFVLSLSWFGLRKKAKGKREKGGELRRPSGYLCVSFVHQMLREMVPGRTGNEVLASVVSAMGAESIEGRIYTHPIGDVMHAAGPNIGLADMNNGPLAASGTFQLRAEVSASFSKDSTTSIIRRRKEGIECTTFEKQGETAGESLVEAFGSMPANFSFHSTCP